MDFFELLDDHAALSFEKQLALADLVGEEDWHLSLGQGTLSFVSGQRFPIQVLGSEAWESNTWLWAWANTQSNIPPALLDAANALQDFGQQHGISELADPIRDLSHVNGHLLAVVACGLLGASCYYRTPYAGGAAFVLLDASSVPLLPTTDPIRIINVFTEMVSTLTVDHRRAFLSYMAQKGCACTESPAGIAARRADGVRFEAHFDDQGRLIELSTTTES